MFKRLLGVAAIAGMVAACSHNVYLVGRTNGLSARTVIKTAGQHGGDMTITVGSKVYSGTWVLKNNGGIVGAGPAGSFTASNSSSNGSVLLAAVDGSTIRCLFDYDSLSKTGLGVCQDSAGAMYDLQIN